MVERKEIIHGYHGFKDLCAGCDKYELRMREQGHYGNMPKTSKHIYLTIIKTGYDNEGREIIRGEYYCQNCASAKLKEMNALISVALPPETNSGQLLQSSSSQAYEEFKRLWWESEREKKIKH